MADDTTDVFSADESTRQPEPVKTEPAYRVYADSKIAVGKGVGKMWRLRFDTAMRAYAPMHLAWDEAYRYYNYDQTLALASSGGSEGVKRGDGSENIVFSNINVLLNAVYTKNPDITCNTTDADDKPFTKSLQVLLNALFHRKDKLNAKSKLRRMAGFAALTDFGVLKLEFTKKDEGREKIVEELKTISQELAVVKDAQEAEVLQGKLEALQEQVLTASPNGARLGTIRPENLIVDPEPDEGQEAGWMIERVFLPTQMLNAQYTQDGEDGQGYLVYKPTHRAEFGSGGAERDDALGLVLSTLSGTEANIPTAHSVEERLEYLNKYYTECFYVWDKVTRRVLLFQRDDWSWPIWVWDDPYNLSRFFPYFIATYSFLTGGVVGAGEVARYLDQQDEVNIINKQVAKIRRTIFNFFYFNSDKTNEDEATKFVDALRGGKKGKHVLGVRAGDGKASDMIEAFLPPAAKYEAFFNKAPALDAINRISNVNEGLRGVQFKTNTNEAAVNTYQDSLRIAIGAKVDVIEDVVADLAQALAEMCVQFYEKADVEGLIGKTPAEAWNSMTVDELNSAISLDVVAGSTEKPNSVYKKKEAVQIAQAIGQFAQAAPGAALRIMLRVMEQAFTEVNITEDDWNALDKEVAANLTRGQSTGEGSAQAPGQDIQALLQNAPPEFKQRIVQMKQQGATDEQLKAEVMKFVQGQGGGTQQPPAPQQQQQ